MKVLTCLRILGSGYSLRGMYYQGQIGREATRTYMKHFRGIREVSGSRCLSNRPRPKQLYDISEKYGEVGFPECVGSVYCMKLHWKHFPNDLKVPYHISRDGKIATIQVEA